MSDVQFNELKGNPKNPRLMKDFDADALMVSLEEFGDLSGIVRNVATDQLVGGHQRINTFKRLPDEKKIVITQRFETPNRVGTTAVGYITYKGEFYAYREVDWPIDGQDDDGLPMSSKEIAANLAANQIEGNWDLDLKAELDWWLKENNPDMLMKTGQSDEEISRLLDGVGGDSTLDEEDEAPTIDESIPAVSETGKVYQLGPHRLMCADSASDDDVARLMNGQRAQMVFTDPPYNIDYTGRTKDKLKIQNDKMSGSQFTQFLDAVCANLHKYNDGAEYICMSSAELDTLKQSFVRTGGHFQNYIIWVKDHFTLTGSDYQHKYEPIVYGWPDRVINHYYVGHRDVANVWDDIHESGATFDGEYTSIKVGDYEVRILGQVQGEVHNKKSKSDVWRFNRPIKSEEHPTMKPLALCEEAILNSSLRDGIVLDLFGGSGSTLLAADRQGRVCYMMELDPQYMDVIRKRYWKHLHDGNEDGWQEGTPEISTAQ